MKLFKALIILSLIPLSACSYFFPDKEKDYVYSKQIATLEMPPDLKAENNSVDITESFDPITLSNTIEFIQQESQAYLLINSTFAHVWRVVGKALTERSIEITDKNRSLATYYVQYDPNAKDVEDGSYWDEVIFFFGSDPHQEKPYQVFLAKLNQRTQVFIRDEQGRPLSQGEGLQLLTALFETIKKDFEK